MSLSPRQFYIDLYREHLEEASFLYDQRRTLFENPEIPWPRLGEFEDRFEAHIDALVVGGDLALEVCQQRAVEGDAGELHAAVRVFCRQNRKDLFLRVVEGLDFEDADKCRAVADALCHELPGEWQNDWVGMLAKGDPRILPTVACVVGYRRLKRVDLLPALSKAPPGGVTTILWALGRLGDPGACSSLQRWLKHEDEAARQAAVLALLRLHETQTVQECLPRVYEESWPALALGLGGGRLTVQVLLEVVSAGKATAEVLLALGLLGDVTAISALLDRLTNPEGADTVALALHLITGAQLWEEALIPDKIDEAELFEAEREKLRKGEALPVTGTKVTRLSQNPEDWRKWWTTNQARFNTKIRHRLGKPYSPAILLEQLESERSPHKVRRHVYEELTIRYGTDVAFEADLPVAQQRQVLGSLGQWVKANGGRFQEGIWYYAGRPSSS
ncbi:MAG TPA: HEAT repeat domain-containing protein [Gemmataceae bacterium]|nr:HEAT repeat domain-containing protein [Gemmataceae bacterium]